jgi:hypothetical protein
VYKKLEAQGVKKKMMKKPYQYSIAEEYSRLLFYIFIWLTLDSRGSLISFYAPHENTTQKRSSEKAFLFNYFIMD